MGTEETKVIVLAFGRKPKNLETEITAWRHDKVSYIAAFDSMSQALTGLHTLLETTGLELSPHRAEDRWIQVKVPEKMEKRFPQVVIIPLDNLFEQHKRAFIEIPRD